MTSWIDVIDKLHSLGYSIVLEGEKLKYDYQGRDKPPQNKITPLIEVLKAHKEEILHDPDFLDQADFAGDK